MDFDSFDGGEEDKHISDRFVEISKIFARQDAFFFGKEPFDKV